MWKPHSKIYDFFSFENRVISWGTIFTLQIFLHIEDTLGHWAKTPKSLKMLWKVMQACPVWLIFSNCEKVCKFDLISNSSKAAAPAHQIWWKDQKIIENWCRFRHQGTRKACKCFDGIWKHFAFYRSLLSLGFREAIVQKIPEFYEIISQTGRGGQSDFISLIQKWLSLSNHPFFKDPLS